MYARPAPWPPSSSGLGRRPFKPEARVRIPLGARWGRGEAWSSRRPVKPEIAGSNPVVPAKRWSQGQVAQSVERRSEKPEVASSILALTTSHRNAPTRAACRGSRGLTLELCTAIISEARPCLLQHLGHSDSRGRLMSITRFINVIPRRRVPSCASRGGAVLRTIDHQGVAVTLPVSNRS